MRPRAYARVLEPAPTPYLVGFGADGIDPARFLDRGFGERHVRRAFEREPEHLAPFSEHGISIPFPQRKCASSGCRRLSTGDGRQRPVDGTHRRHDARRSSIVSTPRPEPDRGPFKSAHGLGLLRQARKCSFLQRLGTVEVKFWSTRGMLSFF